MKQAKEIQAPRRRFLQQLMLLGGATGAGAIAFTSAELVSAATPHTPRANETRSKGYHLTEHIRTYYAKAQI